MKIGIYNHYMASTLWTADAVPIYLNYVPNATDYPFVVVSHISSNNNYAMIDSTHPKGYDYVLPAIFQFTVLGNDRQHSTIENIADQLEDLFHKTQLTLAASVTNFGTLVTDSRTTFFNQSNKVWQISQNYQFWAGK